jgi:hypothetical protein
VHGDGFRRFLRALCGAERALVHNEDALLDVDDAPRNYDDAPREVVDAPPEMNDAHTGAPPGTGGTQLGNVGPWKCCRPPASIDAGADSRARRGAGVGQLTVFLRGALPQAGVRERRVVAPVAKETACRDIVEISLFTVVAPALGDQVALSRPRAIDQQVDPRSGHGTVRLGQRRLLSDDRR